MLASDAEILVDDPHGGHAPQTDDDLGFEQGGLGPQIADAGVLLDVQGVTVPGRAALDDVGNVDVAAVPTTVGSVPAAAATTTITTTTAAATVAAAADACAIAR